MSLLHRLRSTFSIARDKTSTDSESVSTSLDGDTESPSATKRVNAGTSKLHSDLFRKQSRISIASNAASRKISSGFRHTMHRMSSAMQQASFVFHLPSNHDSIPACSSEPKVTFNFRPRQNEHRNTVPQLIEEEEPSADFSYTATPKSKAIKKQTAVDDAEEEEEEVVEEPESPRDVKAVFQLVPSCQEVQKLSSVMTRLKHQATVAEMGNRLNVPQEEAADPKETSKKRHSFHAQQSITWRVITGAKKKVSSIRKIESIDKEEKEKEKLRQSIRRQRRSVKRAPKHSKSEAQLKVPALHIPDAPPTPRKPIRKCSSVREAIPCDPADARFPNRTSLLDVTGDIGGNSSDEADEAIKRKDSTVAVVRKSSVRLMSKQVCVHNYERVCTIGTGTFGRVHLVKEHTENKFYALKILCIKDVIRANQVQHVHDEKGILETLEHPFVINMHWAYQDQTFLYLMFDYIPGGELFSYLRNANRFPNETAVFYASEIVLVLEYLHRQHIVYRDLKPENLLLGADGHLKITDFGFAKRLEDGRTWTVCGTPEYLAPEIIESKGHNKAVDWWALGILIYEMLAGFPPFSGDNPLEIYNKVVNSKLKFPRWFDPEAKDVCKKLLSVDRTVRLGTSKTGTSDVKSHKWFCDVNWVEALEKGICPPIVPILTSEGDPGNFDEYEEKALEDFEAASECELEQFANWC